MFGKRVNYKVTIVILLFFLSITSSFCSGETYLENIKQIFSVKGVKIITGFSLSPNHLFLAFVKDEYTEPFLDEYRSSLCLLNLDTRKINKIIDKAVLYPKWLNDKEVIYMDVEYSDDLYNLYSKIIKFNLITNKEEKIYENYDEISFFSVSSKSDKILIYPGGSNQLPLMIDTSTNKKESLKWLNGYICNIIDANELLCYYNNTIYKANMLDRKISSLYSSNGIIEEVNMSSDGNIIAFKKKERLNECENMKVKLCLFYPNRNKEVCVKDLDLESHIELFPDGKKIIFTYQGRLYISEIINR